MSAGSAADEYAGVRGRITALVDEDSAMLPVPACPEWRVRDVVAHLVGLARAWVDADLDGYASPAWTAAQVETRSTATVAALVAEWEAVATALDARLRDPVGHGLPRSMPGLALGDAVTHEHDLRAATRHPGAREVEAVRISFEGSLRQLGRALEKADAGAVQVTIEDGVSVVGAGDVTTAVAAPRFEIWRSLAGRRSRAQVDAWHWDGPRDAPLAHWLAWPFEWPAVDLDE